MAYAFNEDRSKVDVYTADQIDEMDLANDGDLQDEIANRIAAVTAEANIRQQADVDEAAARSSADTLVNARIDTLVDHGTGGIEVREEIWSSNTGVVSGTVSVSDFSPSIYDCFEIIIGNGNNDTEIHRVAKNGGTVSTSLITGDNKMQTGSISVAFATNEILITNARYIEYASSGDTHTFANSTTNTMPVLKAVYGIKYAQDCSAEVADIRVGYDGAVYPAAGDAVREQAQTISGSLHDLEGVVFNKKETSGVVVDLVDCFDLISVDNIADGLTCLGGKNMLPVASAETKSSNGITIVSDGNGSYTITRTESSQSGVNIRFELPESVFVPIGVDVYVHFLNNLANGNCVLNLLDDNATQICSVAASPKNRIYQATTLGGHRIKYVGFYLGSGFTGTIKLSPMVLFTGLEERKYIPFNGISETSGKLPDVLDDKLSYIWSNASTATPISVAYITKNGGNLKHDVEMLGIRKSASGVVLDLEHLSYINAVSELSTGNVFNGDVTVVSGRNLLPKSSEITIESYGVTIESDGNGGYILSGTATAGELVYIKLDDVVTFPNSNNIQMYLHYRNDVISSETSVGISNASKTWYHEATQNPVNRILSFNDANGKDVSYIYIYHSAAADYSTPLHIHPILTYSPEVVGDETFDGVSVGSDNIMPSVFNSSHCWLWANDGTELSVDYTVCADYLETEIENLQNIQSQSDANVFLRNKDVLPWVYASSNYGVNGSGQMNYNKQLSMLVLTDVHGCAKQVSNWVEYLNGIDSLDCGINLGDTTASYYTDSDGTWYTNIVNTSEKPIFTILGNHDVWSPTLNIDSAPTENMAFYKWIRPTLSVMGISTDKPYYVKNFDEYGVTLICLNNYGIPNNLDTGGVYNTRRDLDAWSQAHVDWFVSALQSVPSGYHLIVAAHDLPSGNPSVTVQECAWTRVLPSQGIISGNGSPNVDTMFQDVIDAWINGTSIAKTYIPTSYPGLYDAEDFPTLQVNADFSSRGAGIFATFMFGHVHSDTYAKITQYAGQNVVAFASSANDNYQNANTDLPRISDTKMEDCLTVVSIDTDNRLVKLVRIGSNKTINMTDRTVFEYSY